MKIIFVGTVEFSRKTLEKLIAMNANIAGVITKKHSRFHSDFSGLEDLAARNNIECHFPRSINDPETLSWIKGKNPDFVFCFGWSELFKKEFLSIPKSGVIGYHSALLPKNRGRHPLIWALVLGLKETGSTFYFMDEGADSGDILSQEKVDISYEDDARALYDKIMDTGLKQIEKILPALVDGTYKRMPQDHSKATYWRKRGMEDGNIDWRMSSYSIYNLVRALARPYPGAHLILEGKEFKVWKVKEVNVGGMENFEPGKVIEAYDDGSYMVKAGDNCIQIMEHEIEKELKPGDYLI
jgi:methionyl-tRNA formyltransferase